MCVQCVANSVPYVGLAVGGLRLMSWNARKSARKLSADRGTAPDLHHVQARDTSAIPQSHDDAFAFVVGDLSVDEVSVDP